MGIYIPVSKRDRLLKYRYSSTDLSLTSVRPPRLPAGLPLVRGAQQSSVLGL